MPPVPYTEKTGSHGVDRTLASTGPTHSVSRSSEDAGVGLRPDAGWVRPVPLMWQHTEKTVSDGTLGESGSLLEVTGRLLEVTGCWGPASGRA